MVLKPLVPELQGGMDFSHLYMELARRNHPRTYSWMVHWLEVHSLDSAHGFKIRAKTRGLRVRTMSG